MWEFIITIYTDIKKIIIKYYFKKSHHDKEVWIKIQKKIAPDFINKFNFPTLDPRGFSTRLEHLKYLKNHIFYNFNNSEKQTKLNDLHQKIDATLMQIDDIYTRNDYAFFTDNTGETNGYSSACYSVYITLSKEDAEASFPQIFKLEKKAKTLQKNKKNIIDSYNALYQACQKI